MAKTKIKSRLYISRLEGGDNYYISCHPGEPSIAVPGFEALKRKMVRLASYNPSVFYEIPMVAVQPYSSQKHAKIYGIFNQLREYVHKNAQDFARRQPELSTPKETAAVNNAERESEGILAGVN
jgi:hypothetical protein